MFVFDRDLAPYLDRAIAAELSGELTDAGLNVIDLAKPSGLQKDKLYRILSARRSCTVVELMKICAAIPVDPYELLRSATTRAERIRRTTIERAEEAEGQMSEVF
ncbi:helix-turn-helix domain-containing protein [Leifsonia sp. McL0607]|uniref:helix-turn-helix domain-containing protein n=1 Tax=Leifsonia sp. McL0607 TaxID=3415672 RepID=UPI003CF590D4